VLIVSCAGNIPKDTREKDLERFFRHYGRIRDILVKPGYGFVEFDDYRCVFFCYVELMR
jgi:RNA recognition motif-containing protein